MTDTRKIAEADVICGLKNRWSTEILHCGDKCPNCEAIILGMHKCLRGDNPTQIQGKEWLKDA